MKTDRSEPRKPPYLLVEPEYWRCPVHVFTGATWFVLGIMVGLAFAAMF